MPVRGVHRRARRPAQSFSDVPAGAGYVERRAGGRYAIRIDWNDGHNAGIYSYEHFRRICPCQECQGAPLEPPA